MPAGSVDPRVICMGVCALPYQRRCLATSGIGNVALSSIIVGFEHVDSFHVAEHDFVFAAE